MKKRLISPYFQGLITVAQAKDTGMAMVLIFLLVAIFFNNRLSLFASLFLLIVDMVWPGLFKPIARVWIGLSHLLGTVMSKIILTIVFFFILTPVGVIRKWLGADAMQLKKWKKDTSSVFTDRHKMYQPKDIEKPY
jgi:hypothetical protein